MNVFKLLWGVLASGNVAEWAALAVGVMLVLGGVFGYGYHLGQAGVIKQVVQAQAPAVAAQAKHDKDLHVAATTKSADVKAADAKHDAKVATVLDQIITATGTPQNSCDVQPDVIKLLNDAGKY